MQRLEGLAEKRIYNVSAPLEHRMCKIYGDLEVPPNPQTPKP